LDPKYLVEEGLEVCEKERVLLRQIILYYFIALFWGLFWNDVSQMVIWFKILLNI